MTALDATYSLGANLSGVGVYSRQILHGLAGLDRTTQWEWFYRSNRFLRATKQPVNVRKRLLFETFGSRSAGLFHGLNQRLPFRRFRRQVATFHDLFVLSAEYSTPEFRERFATQARHAAESADLLIAVSQFTANQIEQYLNVPQARIRVVHHGVVPRVLPNLPREKIVLCVGAIQRRKNQARLVRAFRTMPPDWTLVLAGSEGYEAAEALQAVDESGVRHRIKITGYVSDEELSLWYAKASIFAFPSIDEGFGMPVLEAMAAGIPVLAGNRSALPEVCGDAAVLVNPYDEKAIADGLNRICEKNTGADFESNQEGLARARLFTWQQAVARTKLVYQELG